METKNEKQETKGKFMLLQWSTSLEDEPTAPSTLFYSTRELAERAMRISYQQVDDVVDFPIKEEEDQAHYVIMTDDAISACCGDHSYYWKNVDIDAQKVDQAFLVSAIETEKVSVIAKLYEYADNFQRVNVATSKSEPLPELLRRAATLLRYSKMEEHMHDYTK